MGFYEYFHRIARHMITDVSILSLSRGVRCREGKCTFLHCFNFSSRQAAVNPIVGTQAVLYKQDIEYSISYAYMVPYYDIHAHGFARNKHHMHLLSVLSCERYSSVITNH